MRLALVVLVLMFGNCAAVTTFASGQVSEMAASGNGFLSSCDEVLSESQHVTASGTLCLTYVIGLHDGIGMFADKGGPTELYCQPSGITAGQALRILVKYIKDHPEKSHQATRDLMLAALMQTFPCPAPSSEKQK